MTRIPLRNDQNYFMDLHLNPLLTMARIAQNNLTVTALADGRFFLSGYCNGSRIRLKNPSLELLEKKKTELEEDAAKQAILAASRPLQIWSRLTPAQNAQAEALFNEFGSLPLPLADYIRAGTGLLTDGKPKDATEAMNEFLAWQEKRRLSLFTIRTNRQRVTEFIKFAKIKILSEITPEHCEEFVTDNDLEPNSQVGKGRPICTWLNWCVRKMAGKRSYLKKSPFEVDMQGLLEVAGRDVLEKKRMYSAAKCEALLKAAINHNNGEMVPYTVLALWCYMRHADVMRTTLKRIHLDEASSMEGPFIEAFGRKIGSRPRAIPLPANVLPLLKQCMDRGIMRQDWWKETGEERSPDQLKKLSEYGVVPFTRYGWNKILEAAGVVKFGTGPDFKYNQTVIWSDWQPNILRHTGESYARRLRNNAARVAESSGHSVSTADKHYICIPAPGDTEKFYGINLMLPEQNRASA